MLSATAYALRDTIMRKITLGLAAVAAAASAPALAGTTSGTMNVDLNVTNSCSLTVGNIDFGTLTDFSTLPVSSTSTSTLKCTPNATATVTVTNGLNVNGTQRRLKSGANFIDYNLVNGTNVAWSPTGESFTGTGADVALGLKAVIPVQAAKPQGAYQDTVTINVAY